MAKRIEAKKTPAAPAEMRGALRIAWRRLWSDQPSEKALAILLAQWALETGRGKSMVCFNVGNAKATEKEDHCYFSTLEVLPRRTANAYVHASTHKHPCEIAEDNGGMDLKVRFKPDHPACRFRAFNTIEDGCVDYLRMLRNRFALAWPSLLAGIPEAFVRALRQQRYFTADEAEYSRAIRLLFNEFVLHDEADDTIESTNVDTIAGVQKSLVLLSIDPGLIDGVLGPQTKSAIMRFQRHRKITADGVPGPVTREELRKALAEKLKCPPANDVSKNTA
jgi:hypothetical protein